MVGLRSDKSSTTPTASTTSAPTTASSAATTRVVPSQVLPSDQQIKQTTLLDLARHGDIDTGVSADAKADPPNCALVNAPARASAIGQALSVAGLGFRDKPGDDFGASAYTFVAVFDTAEAADAGLAKVKSAVQSCTIFTDLERSKSDAPAKPWAVSDVKTTPHQISWNNAEQGDDAPWVCAKALRVQDNLLVATMLCDSNPADTPTKLIDVIIANAEARR